MFAGAKENTSKHKQQWRKGKNVNKWVKTHSTGA